MQHNFTLDCTTLTSQQALDLTLDAPTSAITGQLVLSVSLFVPGNTQLGVSDRDTGRAVSLIGPQVTWTEGAGSAEGTLVLGVAAKSLLQKRQV